MNLPKIKRVLPSEIKDLVMYKEVGFDLETAGRLMAKDDIAVCQIYLPENHTSYVIEVDCISGEISNRELDILKEIIPTLSIVGANLMFDVPRVMYHWEIAEPTIVCDTVILGRMLQEQQKDNSLKGMAHRELPFMREHIEFIPAEKEGDIYVHDMNKPKEFKYCGLDPYLAYELWTKIKNELKFMKIKQIFNIEMKSLQKFCVMSAEGIKVDVDVYNETLNQVKTEMDREQKVLNELVGYPIKVNSTAQLCKLLYDEQGLECRNFTPKGARSANADALSFYKDNVYVSQIIKVKEKSAAYSGSRKFKNFFVNGKVHPEYKVVGYDGTGRVYTSEPSLNQLPRIMRKCLVAPKGKKYVYFDLSAAEFYLVAYLAGQLDICELYEREEDLHTYIGSKIIKEENLGDRGRDVSKVVTFSTLYGSEGYAVATALNIPKNFAEELIRRFRNEFSNIESFRQKTMSNATMFGEVSTLCGRVRKLPNIKSNNFKEKNQERRRAFNTIAQAGIADFQKIILSRVTDPRFRARFSVFDSFFLEVDEDLSKVEIRNYIEKLVDFNDMFAGLKFNFKYKVKDNFYDLDPK